MIHGAFHAIWTSPPLCVKIHPDHVSIHFHVINTNEMYVYVSQELTNSKLYKKKIPLISWVSKTIN